MSDLAYTPTTMAEIATKLSFHKTAVDDVTDNTVGTTGVIPEELKDLAFKMTEAAMIHKFYLKLAKQKTGTHGVESKAFKMSKEKKSKEGLKVDPNESIVYGRDPEVVVDLLNIKIKYAKKEEEKTKAAYEREMRKTEEKIEKGTRRWRKLREKLQSYKNKKWRELEIEYNEKIANLVAKYNVKQKEKRTKEEHEEDELIEGIVVNDKELKDILEKEGEIEIAQYGKFTRPLDNDEKAALKLHPKFAMYEKIDIMKIREDLEITKTKIRW